VQEVLCVLRSIYTTWWVDSAISMIDLISQNQQNHAVCVYCKFLQNTVKFE